MLIATKFVLVAKGRPTFGSIDINVECKRQANRKRTANGERRTRLACKPAATYAAATRQSDSSSASAAGE
jgi:hypothetical protein